MATIPRHYSTSGVTAQPNAARANTHMYDSLYAGAGEGLMEAANQIKAYEDKLKDIERDKTYNQKMNEMSLRMDEIKTQSETQDEGKAVDYYNTEVQKYKTDFLASVTDKKVQRELEKQFNAAGTQGTIKMRGFERKRINSSAMATINDSNEINMRRIDAGVTDAEKAQIFSNFEAQVDKAQENGVMTSEQAGLLKQSAKEDADNIQARNLLNNDPNIALTELENRKKFTNLQPETRIALIKQAKAAVEREKVVKDKMLSEDAQDVLVETRETGSSKNAKQVIERIRAKNGEEAANDYAEELQIEHGAWSTLEDVKALPFDKAEDAIEAIKPEQGDDNFAVKQAAYDRVQVEYGRYRAALAKDPVAAIQQWHGVESKDEILAVQEQLGMDESQVTYLSKQEATTIAQDIMDAPAEKRIEKIQEYALTFKNRDNFDIAYKDLVKNGLPTEVMLVGSIADNPRMVKDMSAAFEIGDTEIKERIKTKDTNGSQTIKQVGQRVAEKLELYRDSLYGGKFDPSKRNARNAKVVDWYNKVESSFITTALYYLDNGMSASEAADAATKDFVGKWNFAGAVRIPTKYNDDKIADNLNNFIKVGLDDVPLHVGNTENVDEERELYREALSNYSRWVTSPNEKGVMLLNHEGLPVHINEDGKVKPLVLKFEDLESDKYNKYKSKSRKQARHGGN